MSVTTQRGPAVVSPRYGLHVTEAEVAEREAFRAQVLAEYGVTLADVDLTGATYERAKAALAADPTAFAAEMQARREEAEAQLADEQHRQAVLLPMAKETGCPFCFGDCPLDRAVDDPDVCRCGFDWGDPDA